MRKNKKDYFLYKKLSITQFLNVILSKPKDFNRLIFLINEKKLFFVYLFKPPLFIQRNHETQIGGRNLIKK